MLNKKWAHLPMNHQRSLLISVALDAMSETMGEDIMAREPSEHITDLLTNVRHYCDRYQIDFDDRLETSRCHHESEVQHDE